MSDEIPESDRDPGIPSELRALFDAARADVVDAPRVERAIHRLPRAISPRIPRIGRILFASLILAGLSTIGAMFLRSSIEDDRAAREPVTEPALPAPAPTTFAPEDSAPPEPEGVPDTIAPPPSEHPARRARPVRNSETERATPPADRAESPPSREVASDEVLEGALLLRARRALDQEPRRALELAEEHADRFPEGRLAPERERIAIEALVQLGRTEDARGRASRFIAGWPNSPHRRAVERAIGH